MMLVQYIWVLEQMVIAVISVKMLNEDLLPTSQSETEEKQVDFEREYLFVLHSIFGKICRFYKNDALSLSTKVTKLLNFISESNISFIVFRSPSHS